MTDYTYTLLIPPDQDGYTLKDGDEVISVKLDGGASRRRLDVLGATVTITATWTTDRRGYEYLRSFFNTGSRRGSVAFYVDLILDLATLTTHTAYFIPGTFSLVSQKGFSYTVQANLEVKRTPPDELDDDFRLIFYGSEVTDGDIADEYFNLLQQLVNFDLDI